MNRAVEFETDAAAPARFTTDEFVRMADLGAFDDMKVELDHGEIIRVTPPYSDHGFVQSQVIAKLYTALANHNVDVVGEVGVRLESDTVQVFDVGVLESGVGQGRLVEPDEVRLAIEIAVTSLSRDRGRKLQNYASAGVQCYWVIDVRGRIAHIYGRPEGAGYLAYDRIAFGDPLAVPGTGVTITLT